MVNPTSPTKTPSRVSCHTKHGTGRKIEDRESKGLATQKATKPGKMKTSTPTENDTSVSKGMKATLDRRTTCDSGILRELRHQGPLPDTPLAATKVTKIPLNAM